MNCPLYGAQSWDPMAKQLKKLQTTQNSMLKNLLGIRLLDKINVCVIYNKTKAKKAQIVARTLKFKYTSYTVSDNKDKWNIILTSWVPAGAKEREVDPTQGGSMI